MSTPSNPQEHVLPAGQDEANQLGYAAPLVGFAGLAAFALLLGMSPWQMWPFVISVALALCAVLLTQGRTPLGVTAIGVLVGVGWILAESARTGVPSFVQCVVPIASYTILLLVLHHATLLRAEALEASRIQAGAGLANIGGKPARLEPAAERAKALLEAFHVWHRDWADQDEPWPAFDCFVREQLLEQVGAKQVRCFRIVADGEQFLPLSAGIEESDDGRRDPPWKPQRIAGQMSIEAHAAATGEAFLQSRATQDERLTALAVGSATPVTWCVPVQYGSETIGLIRVGHLPKRSLRDPALLDLIAEVVSLCWCRVRDVHELGIARRTDLASGVLARSDFLTVATHAVTDSLEALEPVVVMVLSLEGMRKLDDSAQWASRDRCIQLVGSVLNRKVRSDDVIGRFSDDRFVVVLRRVDSALGRLITEKLREAVVEELHREAGGSSPETPGFLIGVRCALVGGQWPSTEAAPRDDRSRIAARAQATLHELVGDAFSRLDAGRLRGEDVTGEDDTDAARAPELATANAGENDARVGAAS